MSTERTAWHPPFTGLLQERCPRWISVSGEVQLTTEPLRVDDFIELRAGAARDPADRGTTLRALWALVTAVALLEYKSVSRPLRRGDVARLLGYGLVWYFSHQRHDAVLVGAEKRRACAGDLLLVLVVHALTPTLREELDDLGLTLRSSDTGYHHVEGFVFDVLVIDLGVAGDHERDELMRWFAGERATWTLEARRWISQHMGGGSPMNATPELEGWDDWVERYIASLPPERRLAGLAPEERLAGLAPEQRLAGLSEAEQVLALPTPLLRALSEEYIASLPPDVQAVVRARRGT